MHGAGLAVAELLDLPTVVLAHTLYRRWTQWAPAIMSLPATRATAGLRPVADDRFVPDVLDRCAAVLGLMPEALDFPGGPDPANTHYVGPILSPADAALAVAGLARPGRRPPGQPARALITFGSTVQRQGEALVPVLDAFDLLRTDEPELRALLTLGGVLDPGEVGRPAVRGGRGSRPARADPSGGRSRRGPRRAEHDHRRARRRDAARDHSQGRDQDDNAERVPADGGRAGPAP